MARLLLDENMPRVLGTWMTGHTFQTVQRAGWAGLKNGELLRTAAADFDVFITLDRSIPFQQSVAGLDIAVLVVRTRSSRLDDLKPLTAQLLAAIDQCLPGTVTYVGEWPRA